jgi:hypothetical protein
VCRLAEGPTEDEVRTFFLEHLQQKELRETQGAASLAEGEEDEAAQVSGQWPCCHRRSQRTHQHRQPGGEQWEC